MKGRFSTLRAAVLVAVGALLQAVLAPELSSWWVTPNFLVLALVAAVPGLRETSGVLLGFFGGVLTDILAGGLFGAGALAGLVAGTLLVRISRRNLAAGGEITRFFLGWVAALAVAVYGTIRLSFLALGGEGIVPLGGLLTVGFLTNALLNGLISFLFCQPLMRLTRAGGEK